MIENLSSKVVSQVVGGGGRAVEKRLGFKMENEVQTQDYRTVLAP